MSDDQDTLSVLSGLPQGETSYDYLVGAWKRCLTQQTQLRKIFGSDQSKEPQKILDNLRALIVSYLGLVMLTPDMFPNSSKPPASQLREKAVSPLCLVPSLLRQGSGTDPYSSTSSSSSPGYADVNKWAIFDSHDLPAALTDLTRRFDGDGLEELIGPPLTYISTQIISGVDDGTTNSTSRSANAANVSSGNNNNAINAAAAAGDVRGVLAHLLGQANNNTPQTGISGSSPGPASTSSEGLNLGSMEWTTYVNAIYDCTEIKGMAANIWKIPSFNPANVSAPSFERASLLGPILHLSTFADSSPAICRDFFPDVSAQSQVHSSQSTLRGTLHTLHGLHFKIFNNLIRSAGTESREAILAYWGSACELNKKRGAMQVRARDVCTDGFMVNLFETVMRFCEPFMDAKYSKIDRIDVEYLRRQRRFAIDDLTRLNASEVEAKEWAESAPPSSSPPNFITECFFIGLRLMNLGPGKAIRTMNERGDELRRFKKRIREIEQDRSSWVGSPQAMQYEMFLKRGQDEVRRLESSLVASECQLLDEDFVTRLIAMICFMMTWLVRVADSDGNHPHTTVVLPLKKEVPVHFRMLPEHIFEDVCDILLFISRYRPNALYETAKNDLVTFCTTFLSSGWFIKNPFLRAKLAEILFYNVLPFGNATSGIVGDVINFHPLALQHLVPALMSFWIEAESTGSHTQFYDKFNIRYHLSRIFKTVWTNSQHKERLNIVAGAPDSDFPIFVNRLLNDVTYLLDDALEKLLELHAKQKEMETESFRQRPNEERAEVEGHTRSLEGQVRSMLEFGNEFLDRLIDFTGEEGKTKDAFMQSEIVGRLASMLDYNLDLMVGPRAQELKVKDPKRVGFHPRELLKKILKVYLNLSKRSEFIKAIAADGRSYRQATFDKAQHIAYKYMLYGAPELDNIKTMVARVEQVRQEEAEEDEELGEVPDEFLGK